MAIKDIDRAIGRLGISSLAEMLFYIPRKIEDLRHPIESVNRIPEVGESVYLKLELSSKQLFDKYGKEVGVDYKAGRAERGQFRFKDKNGATIQAAVFGAVYPWLKLKSGDEIFVKANVDEYRGMKQLLVTDFVPKQNWYKMVPVYAAVRSTASAESMTELVSAALPSINDASTLFQASTGLEESKISDITGYESVESLMMDLHRPNSPEDFYRAKEMAKKVAIEEILAKAERVKARIPVKGSVLLVDDTVGESFHKYQLTGDQKVVIKEILKDLRSMYPMQRLISGDVGTGKSLAFMIPAAEVHRIGKRVVILCPNSGMVNQIAAEFEKDFPWVKTKKVISRAKIKDEDDNDILIGTTALLKFCADNKIVPDLLITDEQQKMSREQREQLAGPGTNMLEATATCIPRTMALISHGGMDVSYLRESPVKKDIKTELVFSDEGAKRRSAFQKIDDIIANGGQVAVVYSMVEDNDDIPRESVESAFDKWEKLYPGKVVKAHGKMSTEDKEAAVDDMKAGRKSIIVASSVVEVGLTIPNLRGMYVADSGVFGASALHQLRGRVSRHGGDGWMYLLADRATTSDDAVARLNLLVEEKDGFRIAERDMEQRGFGDLDINSTTQSGDTGGLTFKGDITIKPSELKQYVGEVNDLLEVVSASQNEEIVIMSNAVQKVSDQAQGNDKPVEKRPLFSSKPLAAPVLTESPEPEPEAPAPRPRFILKF